MTATAVSAETANEEDSLETADRDKWAYVYSVKKPLKEVVGELIEALGLRVVAEIAEVKETRAVREWANGGREISRGVPCRLRFALRLVRLIVGSGELSQEKIELARAWFESYSSVLGNKSPAEFLRDERVDEAVGGREQLIEAARAVLLET